MTTSAFAFNHGRAGGGRGTFVELAVWGSAPVFLMVALRSIHNGSSLRLSVNKKQNEGYEMQKSACRRIRVGKQWGGERMLQKRGMTQGGWGVGTCYRHAVACDTWCA
jgi:hypothetical protein